MKLQSYKILGYLQLFIGMSAISGGLPMLLSPEGSDQGLSIDLLLNTPFDNYFIPGLLLLSVNGIGSLIASFFSLKIKMEASVLGVIFGTGLIIWIVTQFLMLGYHSWLQPFYLALGVAELFLGIKISRQSY